MSAVGEIPPSSVASREQGSMGMRRAVRGRGDRHTSIYSKIKALKILALREKQVLKMPTPFCVRKINGCSPMICSKTYIQYCTNENENEKMNTYTYDLFPTFRIVVDQYLTITFAP